MDSFGRSAILLTSKREEQRKEDVTKEEGDIYTDADVVFKRQLRVS